MCTPWGPNSATAAGDSPGGSRSSKPLASSLGLSAQEKGGTGPVTLAVYLTQSFPSRERLVSIYQMFQQVLAHCP